MKLYSIVFFVLLTFSSFGQFDHEPVFPNLEGNSLYEALVNEYKTSTVLSYAMARDTFMLNIDLRGNQLECVYTGYKVTINPGEDPTTVAFDQGINTEHTYPRSQGAQEGTNAYSDMHHLFPTKVNVNSDRGNLIFAEVPDNQTDKWYRDDEVRTNIPPSSTRDEYSEYFQNEGFEPREQHKGDVARAYFYFYTMYRDQANQSAPEFFEDQRETMCDWHFLDPVDEKEWDRNVKIAEYQDGKRNPFILDCRIARLYCQDVEGYCETVSTEEIGYKHSTSFPNPATDHLFFEASIDTPFEQYIIYNNIGAVVQQGYVYNDLNRASIDVSQLSTGFHIVQLLDSQSRAISVSRFIKQ